MPVRGCQDSRHIPIIQSSNQDSIGGSCLATAVTIQYSLRIGSDPPLFTAHVAVHHGEILPAYAAIMRHELPVSNPSGRSCFLGSAINATSIWVEVGKAAGSSSLPGASVEASSETLWGSSSEDTSSFRCLIRDDCSSWASNNWALLVVHKITFSWFPMVSICFP